MLLSHLVGASDGELFVLRCRRIVVRVMEHTEDLKRALNAGRLPLYMGLALRGTAWVFPFEHDAHRLSILLVPVTDEKHDSCFPS